MAQMFGCQIGLSDHTMGIGVALAATGLGATVVEKHFTLRRADGGVDSAFSIEPDELNSLVVESERACLSLGEVSYGVQKNEQKSLLFKRSLFAVKDIKTGEPLTRENIKVIRPGKGLAPKHFDTVLESKASSDIAKGTPLTWGMVSNA